MKNKKIKLKVTLIAIITLFLLLLSYISYFSNFIINTTKSIPIGVYVSLNSKDPLDKNDLISFCLNDEYFKNLAIKFDFIKENGGRWCNGVQPILKPIVAVKGDIVFINKDGITVNGNLISNTKPILDIKNSSNFVYKKTLEEDEFIVASSEPTGYDSRYYGIIKLSDINTKIKPVITF